MPNQQTHLPLVREWCQSLGILTAVSISRAEAEMKLAAYIPMLMLDFPDAAFTTESLRHVARQCTKGFPTFPELANHLSAWWREHRPFIALPPPPPQLPPERTPDEIAYVEARVAECLAMLRSSAQPPEDRRLTARHLSPEQLDILNPLPGGRRRGQTTTQ